MKRRKKRIATRFIVAGLLITTATTTVSGCSFATNSTEDTEVVENVEETKKVETKAEAETETETEQEKFQKQYEAELEELAKEMGLSVSDANPYCDRGYVKTETGDDLNIREKPDETSEILTKLEPGTIVRVIRKEEGFYRVVFQQEDKWQVGYAAEEYIQISYKDILDYELVAVAVHTWPEKANDSNRNHNLSLACDKINGLILKSGEKYDWYGPNGVGPATKERGFKLAGVIANGASATGYGGGVCQVATAIYNCALQLELKIIEINNHSHKSHYAEEGKDATVDYGSGLNLVFENTTSYDLYIEAYASRGQVVVLMYYMI